MRRPHLHLAFDGLPPQREPKARTRGHEAKPGDLPAFMLPNWKNGIVSKLPDLGQPFVLLLTGADLANAELKELAGLKSLQALGSIAPT
jgi:hypothetical protein